MTGWGDAAVEKYRSWGPRRQRWVRWRTRQLLAHRPFAGGSRAVRTMLLAIACGRGPDVGMDEELSLTPFNIGAYHLQRSLNATSSELETLYREGVGLHYEHPEILGRKYRSWMSLAVAVRHLAEYPSLSGDLLDDEALQPMEKDVLRILIGESRRGWRQEDSRTLVAAALDLLQLDDAEREVLAVLRADRSGSETPWGDLHADVRAAQALVE